MEIIFLGGFMNFWELIVDYVNLSHVLKKNDLKKF